MKTQAFTLSLLAMTLMAGEPRLVKEMAPGTSLQSIHEHTTGFIEAAGTAFFIAEHPEHGPQLWKTDGTPAGTQQVLWSPGFIKILGAHPDYLLLSQASQVYATDGTPAGTRRLVSAGASARPLGDGFILDYTENPSRDRLAYTDGTRVEVIYEGANSNERVYWWNTGGSRLFFKYQNNGKYYLATSNGSVDGTRTLLEVRPDSAIVLDQGTLVDLTYNYSRNVVLSDGTFAGTRLLFEDDESGIFQIQQESDFVLFQVTSRNELWYSDGYTANAIATLPAGGIASGTGLELAGKPVFFVQANGQTQLFTTDGTVAGTSAITPAMAIDTSKSFFVWQSGLLFATQDNGLWLTDGNPETIIQLSDNPANLHAAAVLAGKAYFMRDGEIWRTDGTLAGTEYVADTDSTNLVDSGVTEDRIFMKTTSLGTEKIWTSDGTTVGTERLYIGESANGDETLVHENRFYFQMADGLWVTDGSPAGTQKLSENASLPLFLDGKSLFAKDQEGFEDLPHVFDGSLVSALTTPDQLGNSYAIEDLIAGSGQIFGAASIGSRDAIFNSNGEAISTQVIQDVTSYEAMSPLGNGLVFIANGLFFYENGTTTELADPIGSNFQIVKVGDLAYLADRQIWRTGGTIAGTEALNLYLDNLGQLAEINGNLVGTFGISYGLARLEGDGAEELIGLPVKPNSTQSLVPVKNHLFTMVELDYVLQAWLTDGTLAGTRMLADHSALDNDGNWQASTMGDGLAYILNDNELWVSDYTSAGTRKVMSLTDEYGPLTVTQLHDLKGILMIIAYNARGDYQLWRSLGESHTTYKLRDFLSIGEAQVLGNQLYLSAFTAEYGQELWQSDATGPGTHPVTDLNPGVLPSSPGSLTPSEAQLFFSAYTEASGRELYVMCIDDSGPIEVATDVCAGSTGHVARAPIFGASAAFDWQIEGGTILSQNGHEITWEPTGTTPVVLTATATLPDGCHGNYTATVSVSENGPTALTAITGPTNVCAFASEVAYEVPATSGAMSYEWTVPAGASLVAGQGTRSVLVNFEEGVGEISVLAQNGCGQTAPVSLTVTHTRLPALADAGPDQALCANTTQLAANGTSGSWSIISGFGGQFGDSSSPTTSFSGLPGETYLLRWTISGGDCGDSFDYVRISFLPVPDSVDAGEDQAICGFYVDLNASLPELGTGTWSIISGDGGFFNNASDPTTRFQGSRGQTYLLRWTVETPACGSSYDEVMVQLEDFPIARVGEMKSLALGGTITLQGEEPTQGSGIWEITEGPDLSSDQMVDTTDPNTLFTPTGVGTYRIRWRVTNGSCGSHDATAWILVGETPEETPFNGAPDQYTPEIIGQIDGWLLYEDDINSLWRTDGVTNEQISIDLIRPRRGGLQLADDFYFFGNSILWKTRGTLETTEHVKILDHNTSSSLARLGDTLYWIEWNYNSSAYLYKSDGTELGTEQVAQINQRQTQDTFTSMVILDDILYFVASDTDHGSELWRSDGTELGTYRVTEIRAAGEGNILANRLLLFDEQLYFFAQQEDTSWAVMHSDGTEIGTQILDGADGFVNPGGIAVSQSDLYFSADGNLHAWNQVQGLRQIGALNDDLSDAVDLVDGRILIPQTASVTICDGSTLTTLKDWLGNDLLFSKYFTPFEGHYYFLAEDGVSGDLWRTDLTDAGTIPLADDDDTYLFPRNITPINGMLYYIGQWGTHSSKLQGLCATPAAAIETAAALCAGVPQNTASVTDAGRGTTYDWAVTGATILDGQNTPEITYQVDGGGAVTIEVTVTRPGGCEAYDAVTIPAGSMSWTLWANPDAYRDERDLDANGRIDILDYAAFFDSCN